MNQAHFKKLHRTVNKLIFKDSYLYSGNQLPISSRLEINMPIVDTWAHPYLWEFFK